MCDNEVNFVGVRFSTEVEKTKIRFLIFSILYRSEVFMIIRYFLLCSFFIFVSIVFYCGLNILKPSLKKSAWKAI